MAGQDSKSEAVATEASQSFTRTEFYDRMRHDYLPPQGGWFSLAGFTPGMPVKIRVMPGCIVITTQKTRELRGAPRA